MAYDDAKYGVVERMWLGLSKKWGGDRPNARVASGQGCFGTTDATTKTHFAKVYFRGPVNMIKAGAMGLATIVNASVDRIPMRVLTRGASASLGCLLYLTKLAPAAIASSTTFTVRQVKPGEYITVKTGTPQTDKATAANTATTNGTVAFFIDYRRKYTEDGKHDVPRGA